MVKNIKFMKIEASQAKILPALPSLK